MKPHDYLEFHTTWVSCIACGRKWRSDRLGVPGNMEYLVSHAQDHQPIHRRTAEELGWTSDEERSES